MTRKLRYNNIHFIKRATLNKGGFLFENSSVGTIESNLSETLSSLAKHYSLDIVSSSNLFDDSITNRIINTYEEKEILLYPPMSSSTLYRTDFLKQNNIVYSKEHDLAFHIKTLLCAKRIFYINAFEPKNKTDTSIEDFKEIEDFLQMNSKNREKFESYKNYVKFKYYINHLKTRTKEERKIFLIRFSQEFKHAKIVKDDFTKKEYGDLKTIIYMPESYR